MDSTKYAMSAEELLRQYARTRDPKMRDIIAEKYLHIARIVARKFSGRGVEFDDLFQVASLALMKAIDRFDPDMGVRFQTFATPTMVGAVKNYFRDKSRMMTMPRRGMELYRKLRDVLDELEKELMRKPTPVELADALHVPVEAVIETLEMQSALIPDSLDTAPTGEDELSVGSFIGYEDEGFFRFEQRDQIKNLLSRLHDSEKNVIERRYFQQMSQREIACQMGVSQMTVSRMERRALIRLRQWMEEEDT